MTPEEIQRAIAIAAAKAQAEAEQAAASAPPPVADRDAADAAQHSAEVRLRGRIQSAASIPALATIPADIIGGGARFLYNAAARGVGKPDAQVAPDAPLFSLTGKVMQAGSDAADALGLDQPETTGERVLAGVNEGVTGTAGGLGLGTLLARVPGAAGAIGRFLSSNPAAQTASGVAGSVAASGANEAGAGPVGTLLAGVAGGAVPGAFARTGRQTVTSPGGVDSVAMSILRAQMANPEAATQRVRDFTPAVPGFRHFTTDVARDPGLATASPKLRDWAGGASAEIAENNSTILSRELDRQGAAPGTAARQRDSVRAADEASLDAMNLRSLPRQSVDDMMDRMEAGTDVRRNETSLEVGQAHRELLGLTEEYARPVINTTTGEVVDRRIGPQALHEVRKAISKRRAPTGTKPDDTPSALRHARGETREFSEEIARTIDNATGNQYLPWLTRSRAGRMEADRMQYMEDFAGKVNPSGESTGAGRRIIDRGAWLRQMADSRLAKPIPGGSRVVSYRQLDPERQAFLQAGRRDFNTASYAKRAATTGSNTQNKQDFDERVTEAVMAARSPYAKVTDPILAIIGGGANAASRMAQSPVIAGAGRIAANFGERMLERHTQGAIDRVKRRLGDAEARQQDFLRIMDARDIYNPGVAESLLIRGAHVARGGAHGFLAGARESRYR